MDGTLSSLPACVGVFLSFRLESLVAKMILPFFSGGRAGWNPGLLFFAVSATTLRVRRRLSASHGGNRAIPADQRSPAAERQ